MTNGIDTDLLQKMKEVHLLNQIDEPLDMEIGKKRFEMLPQSEKDAIQKRFEELYGVDYKTRSYEQWKRLVEKYGIDTIMKKEGLTKAYIKSKLKYGKLV